MKLLKHVFSLIIIMVVSLSACVKQPTSVPSDKVPGFDISIKEMNNKLKIISPIGLHNSFKNDQDLSLYLTVISDDQMAFKTDFGAKIFVFQDNQWVEVENRVDYPGEKTQYFSLSPAKGNPAEGASIILRPYKPGLNSVVPMRAIVVGYIMKNGDVTDEKTYGYIDLELKP
jgi:hypothetical protein